MIVMVAYGGGHVAMLAPVERKLRERGYEVVFLALTTAAPFLDRLGIEYVQYRDLPGASDGDVRAWGTQLAVHVPPGGVVDPDETVAYLGLNYRELVATHGAEAAAALFEERGRQAFLPTRLFERWFEELRPEFVVATNSPRSERAAILAAGRLGIRSVCAVDVFAKQEVSWIGQPNYADRVCVLNNGVRRMLLQHGREPDEVVVTGNPAFDHLRDPAVIDAGRALRRRRGWDDDRFTVLWASAPEPERHPNGTPGDPSLPRQVERRLRDFVRGEPGYRLVVRYHPSESEAFMPEANVDLSPSVEPLGALLHAVDLVIVTASTVGLEAAIAGRPVVSVDCSILTADVPYTKMGISTGVRDLADLPAGIARASRSMGAPARLPVAPGVGVTATARVVEVIESLRLSRESE